MENNSIVINRTKEELRRYSVFSAIERRPLRKLMEYLGPLLGVALIVFFVIYSDILFLIMGLFLGFYPFMLRRMIKKSSDLSFDKNNLNNFEITISFNKDSFSTLSGDASQEIKYDDLFRIYSREKDMIIYISKFSGLYINKESYSEEVVSTIMSLIETAVPDKIKTFKY